MKNIILIGMPGSGKSTVGVLLAKLIGYRFIDSDLLIQDAAGKKLYEIIRDDGIAAFEQLENKINSEINVDRTVIATGGSVVYYPEAMEHLKSTGTIVFLNVQKEELEKRIGDFSKRGVLIKHGESFDDLYKERIPLYTKYADITAFLDNNDLLENAKEIIKILEIEE